MSLAYIPNKLTNEFQWSIGIRKQSRGFKFLRKIENEATTIFELKQIQLTVSLPILSNLQLSY